MFSSPPPRNNAEIEELFVVHLRLLVSMESHLQVFERHGASFHLPAFSEDLVNHCPVLPGFDLQPAVLRPLKRASVWSAGAEAAPKTLVSIIFVDMVSAGEPYQILSQPLLDHDTGALMQTSVRGVCVKREALNTGTQGPLIQGPKVRMLLFLS